MGIFILCCFGLGTGLAVLAGWMKEREVEQRAEKERARLAAIKLHTDNIAAFAAKHMVGWSHQSPGKINGEPGLFGISDNGLLIRFATYQPQDDEYALTTEKTVATNSILSYNVVTPERNKTITHKEKMPVAIKQNRSAGGRAAIGGLALGPAGAIVGAASGLNGKDKVEYHDVERHETIRVKGDARLVLGIKDVGTPRLTIDFDPPHLANEWWYRIQSALA